MLYTLPPLWAFGLDQYIHQLTLAATMWWLLMP